MIVNWRSRDLLRRCLETVRLTCSDLDPQLIVVDGGSFDGCGEMLAAGFPEVEFIQCQNNLGFGRLNNLGFERVTGEVLLLLNPDTEALPGAISGLLAELQRRPDAGILAPKLLNSDGSLQTSCVQSLPTPWNQALDSDFLRRLLPNSRLWGVGEAFGATDAVAVEAVSGACMVLRSDVFRRVGGFSPAFFMYGEDMDLCARVGRMGLRVYHVPTAEIVHHGGGSSCAQGSEFATVMKRVAGETYMRLHHGRGTAVWYRALQAASALARLLLLLPACLLPLRGRGYANAALKKWWWVLKWAFSTAPIKLPLQTQTRGQSGMSENAPAAKSDSQRAVRAACVPEAAVRIATSPARDSMAAASERVFVRPASARDFE